MSWNGTSRTDFVGKKLGGGNRRQLGPRGTVWPSSIFGRSPGALRIQTTRQSNPWAPETAKRQFVGPDPKEEPHATAPRSLLTRSPRRPRAQRLAKKCCYVCLAALARDIFCFSANSFTASEAYPMACHGERQSPCWPRILHEYSGLNPPAALRASLWKEFPDARDLR